eukprot:c7810_g1_i1.p1 GENE.c7810_g1_i1~~c7810_g1_i1.p1  ORF type:complete len:113 (-),score=11.67 c7810_g1_i1:50-388(-)
MEVCATTIPFATRFSQLQCPVAPPTSFLMSILTHDWALVCAIALLYFVGSRFLRKKLHTVPQHSPEPPSSRMQQLRAIPVHSPPKPVVPLTAEETQAKISDVTLMVCFTFAI